MLNDSLFCHRIYHGIMLWKTRSIGMVQSKRCVCSVNQIEFFQAEDIEETLQLVVNYLGPLLELNEFTVEDVPYQMKYLTAKYYLIFSREIEPLDILEVRNIFLTT